jgi:hypothetical protein
MFNFRNALLPVNGQQFTLRELQEWLSHMLSDHLSEIAPEIGVRELLLNALKRGWIVEEPKGVLRIQIPEEVAA